MWSNYVNKYPIELLSLQVYVVLLCADTYDKEVIQGQSICKAKHNGEQYAMLKVTS